ncbi:MAG: 4-hydroxy-3-methylbut-2-enyl diphosphate reductase [Thermomicrobium sp.]|jgi:4-hydroxy-3-methylbut-2-enyl diphosphate reductase|uniref:4-hydroxy-3-methylbut-2-enyl diphosphate reductase n=1 Tax=Thermomicrobium sp. TaxID=1969469 RepID=UPI001B269B27|nr:4-hydroxy-3-methylbut-2-enyl diphosphate reductase [Thermomicrobium sp.]MBO9350795.1 4-hydroxy-3-methylbut-2-enyl diphosphate reductase [Thermomicrobium sp.]
MSSRGTPSNATVGEKEIVVAEVLGFCWGVRRALEIVRNAARERPVAALGDIIHNPIVVEQLTREGVLPVTDPVEAKRHGLDRVAITAHGAPPTRYQEASANDLEVIDTTCPLVTKVQRLAQKLALQGYFLVVYGDAQHPEVRGVLGWAGTERACAAKSFDDLPWDGPRGTGAMQPPPRKVALIAQTTKRTDEFTAFAQALAAWVLPHGGELRVVNTICQPTWERQEALARLARTVDLVLVIGGRKSSNSARLVEVSRSLGTPSVLVERPDQLDPALFAPVRRVGITAGASTPDEVILAVIEELVRLGFAPPQRLWRDDDPDVEEFAD